jgi:arabinogalactan endo-1,4-beta-galactosidase
VGQVHRLLPPGRKPRPIVGMYMERRTSSWMVVLVASGALWRCSGENRESIPPRTSSFEPAPPPGASQGVGDTKPSNAAPSPAAPVEVRSDSESGPVPVEREGGDAASNPSGEAAAGAGGASAMPNEAPPAVVFDGRFILGADISSADEAVDGGSVYVDTDGEQKSLVLLLHNHGFNYIRLRTFVNPLAAYGYASSSDCQGKAEAYADKEHTVAFAREIKAAGMGFLLDLHYSDTWADPQKQVIPEAWRGLETLDALAEQVRSHTVDVVTALVAANARPDMVQVGNEITPGLLIHVPSVDTDCFGNDSVVAPGVNGSQDNWDNLATLLRAGIDGVRSVDPTIPVMLHIENTESVSAVSAWVQSAQQRDVTFDVLGLSAYEAFQGPSAAWRSTLVQLALDFPDLAFAIAEYNPQRRLLNDIMRELPDGRGLGTFFWEPTQSGAWGRSMFARQGNRFSANPDDFAEYDRMRADYGL